MKLDHLQKHEAFNLFLQESYPNESKMTEPQKERPTKEELAGYFAIYDRVGSKLSGLRDNMELKEGTRVDRALKTQIATAMIHDNKKPNDAGN